MLSFFPRDVLDEILNFIESVFEGFPSYTLVQAIEYLTQLFQLVVMHSEVCLQHYHRFFPPYGDLSGILFQRSYFLYFLSYFYLKEK